MSIKVKSYKTLKGLMVVPFHPKMIALAMWVATRYSEIVITSAYRGKKIHDKDSGIAFTDPCRHLDIRSWIYPDAQKVADDINEHWQYDPKRSGFKCAVFHDVGQGKHIHLQVHPNTKFLGG